MVRQRRPQLETLPVPSKQLSQREVKITQGATAPQLTLWTQWHRRLFVTKLLWPRRWRTRKIERRFILTTIKEHGRLATWHILMEIRLKRRGRTAYTRFNFQGVSSGRHLTPRTMLVPLTTRIMNVGKSRKMRWRKGFRPIREMKLHGSTKIPFLRITVRIENWWSQNYLNKWNLNKRMFLTNPYIPQI